MPPAVNYCVYFHVILQVVVAKLTDLSTPLLLQHCAMGKTIPKAKFEFFRADGNGERVKYFEMVLENCRYRWNARALAIEVCQNYMEIHPAKN